MSVDKVGFDLSLFLCHFFLERHCLSQLARYRHHTKDLAFLVGRAKTSEGPPRHNLVSLGSWRVSSECRQKLRGECQETGTDGQVQGQSEERLRSIRDEKRELRFNHLYGS